MHCRTRVTYGHGVFKTISVEYRFFHSDSQWKYDTTIYAHALLIVRKLMSDQSLHEARCKSTTDRITVPSLR